MKIVVCYMGMTAAGLARDMAEDIQALRPQDEVVLWQKVKPTATPWQDAGEWGVDACVYVHKEDKNATRYPAC